MTPIKAYYIQSFKLESGAGCRTPDALEVSVALVEGNSVGPGDFLAGHEYKFEIWRGSVCLRITALVDTLRSTTYGCKAIIWPLGVRQMAQ